MYIYIYTCTCIYIYIYIYTLLLTWAMFSFRHRDTTHMVPCGCHDTLAVRITAHVDEWNWMYRSMSYVMTTFVSSTVLCILLQEGEIRKSVSGIVLTNGITVGNSGGPSEGEDRRYVCMYVCMYVYIYIYIKLLLLLLLVMIIIVIVTSHNH